MNLNLLIGLTLCALTVAFILVFSRSLAQGRQIEGLRWQLARARRECIDNHPAGKKLPQTAPVSHRRTG